jgi:hypothetical protein
MTRLITELLPRDVLERTTKAVTHLHVAWADTTRTLIREWSGDGVDPTIVDAAALSHAWRSTEPPLLTSEVVQSCWLAVFSAAAAG